MASPVAHVWMPLANVSAHPHSVAGYSSTTITCCPSSDVTVSVTIGHSALLSLYNVPGVLSPRLHAMMCL